MYDMRIVLSSIVTRRYVSMKHILRPTLLQVVYAQ